MNQYLEMVRRYLPSKEVSRWIYGHMKKRIPAIVLLALCRITTTCTGILFALVTKNVVNSAGSGDHQEFLFSCMELLFIILVEIGLGTLALHLQEKLLYDCDKDFKQSLLHTILYSNYADESKYHSGDLLYRLNSDVSNIYTGILSICTSAVSLVVGLILAAGVLASMAPVFTVVIILICIFLAFATLLVQKNMKTIQKDVSAKSGKVSGFLQEIIEKLLIVQALDIPETIEKKAGKLMDVKIESQRRRKNVYLIMSLGSNALGYVGAFITLVWCAHNILIGTMDYGTLTAMTTLVSQLQGPLLALPAILPKFVTITASGERLMEIEKLNAEQMLFSSSPAALYEHLRTIQANNLSFAYIDKSGEKKMVIRNSSFEIQKNGMTVITGPSGIGKSTILKLLLGIYLPENGSLELVMNDGMKTALDRSVRNLFSFAPQGNLILSGTIRENIMISNPSATAEQLQEAVYVSCMEEYLAELPQGLDTELGENGAGLSEGQIQRVSLARAVLKGAPILLLDEVTSSLDAETEEKVLTRIKALDNKTCIVVTHRLAALKLADYELKVSEDGMRNVKLR